MSVPEEQPTEELLRSLRAVQAVPESSDFGTEISDRRRERMVSSIEATMANLVALRRRRTRWIRASLSVAAVAATVALIWGASEKLRVPLPTGAAEPEQVAALDEAEAAFLGVDGRRLPAGSTLVTGSELRTAPSGFARMALGQRATVLVRGDTQLYLDELQAKRHKVSLQRGRVEVDVLKIPGAPEQLLVVTPDAEVEVKGTAFSVERKPVLGVWVTTVQVTRGRVLVRSQGRSKELGPSESFVSSALRGESQIHGPESVDVLGATASAQKEERARTEQSEKPRALMPSAKKESEALSPTHSEVKTDESRPSLASTLGEQNRLFEKALLARDQGRDAEAIALLTDLMARYPSSPLSRSAQEEVRRARARLGK